MHQAEEPLLIQLVVLLIIVEQVVIGDVQLDVVNGVVLLDEEVVTPPVGVEFVAGVTQIVLAHVIVVSGKVEHDEELFPLMVLQLVVLPVVVTEQVVMGDVQLVIGPVVVVLV